MGKEKLSVVMDIMMDQDGLAAFRFNWQTYPNGHHIVYVCEMENYQLGTVWDILYHSCRKNILISCELPS